VGGAGTVGTLIATGNMEWPFGEKSEEFVIPEGKVAVPVCPRPVPAYTRVARAHLIDPRTGQWNVRWLDPNEVPDGILTNMADIRGRVTARDKAAPYYFVEDDFLPKGTRPGIVAGVPPGKRAVTLEAAKIKGVRGLQVGDHVDLLASIPIDMEKTFGAEAGGFTDAQTVYSPEAMRLTMIPKRSLIKALVQDGVVVAPVETRQVPVASGSLSQRATTRMVVFQEIVFAIDPEEVGPVAEAMDLGFEITCVARSGRPEEEFEQTTITPSADPTGNTHILETMVGNRRQYLVFAKPAGTGVLTADRVPSPATPPPHAGAIYREPEETR